MPSTFKTVYIKYKIFFEKCSLTTTNYILQTKSLNGRLKHVFQKRNDYEKEVFTVKLK